MSERMFNADQEDWMRTLAETPAEKKCACGWSMRGDCFGSCKNDEAKGGFLVCMVGHPRYPNTSCDLRRGHDGDHKHYAHSPFSADPTWAAGRPQEDDNGR